MSFLANRGEKLGRKKVGVNYRIFMNFAYVYINFLMEVDGGRSNSID